MADLDLCFTPASELARLIRSRELSPVEVVANALERIGAVNADGLPVGLQIVGRRFDDAGVLRVAAALEWARPWADRRPPL